MSVIYDKYNTQHIEYYNNLKSNIHSLKYNILNINLFENSIDIKNSDFILVISDDIKKAVKEYNLLNVKNHSIPMYIVTGNLSTSNIVECINLTPYIAYIKNSSTRVMQKIINVLKVRRDGKI